MSTVTGILINPEARTFTAIEVPWSQTDRSLKPFYSVIGCGLVETVTLHPAKPPHPGIVMIIDEEGLLKPNHFFVIPHITGMAPFAGKAVVVLTDGSSFFGTPNVNELIQLLEIAVTFVGDDAGLEEAIQNSVAARPKTTFATSFEPDAPKETIWEWSPHTLSGVDKTTTNSVG